MEVTQSCWESFPLQQKYLFQGDAKAHIQNTEALKCPIWNSVMQFCGSRTKLYKTLVSFRLKY